MMTELSAQTGLCQIQGTTTTDWDAQYALIDNGGFPNWASLSTPSGTQWEVKLYNQQPIEIQGLVAGDMHFKSNAIRIESAEQAKAQIGVYKDPFPAAYGFVREYHVFTTKKMDDTNILNLANLANPFMPGFNGSSLNENQLVFGLAREYTSLSNFNTDPSVFVNDGRLSLSYENVIGSGVPVAQGRIWYTRIVYCWMNAAGGSNPASPPQFLDMPATRASLVGEVVKPQNNIEHFQVLANNEGIGSW
jgi:hypothetical protein